MDPNKTIGVDLWAGQRRGTGLNAKTRVELVRPAGRAADLLFTGAYARFADACRAVDEPGVAIIAVDEVTGAPMGQALVRARVGRHVTAIVGRHDRCDLFVDGRATLALRHLAVIVDPVTDWQPGAACTYRILDLRTADGFVDERGRTLRGLRGDGPAVVRCGGYALFVLPLGDPTDWPASGADAWACLPERIYFDELAHCARGSSTRLPAARADRRHSSVTSVSAVRGTDTCLVEHDDLVGTLEIETAQRSLTIQVGRAALRDGILLGRYDRCDGSSDDSQLSRVHALLIQLGDTLLVIDTASTHGTSMSDGPAIRALALLADADLQLASTIVRWRWLS